MSYYVFVISFSAEMLGKNYQFSAVMLGKNYYFQP